jgi:glutamyl-Q tRNA(Asp) synthetase
LAHPGITTTRFAPSPTGRLHLGHAFSALFAERAARAGGGSFLLRLEDIDATRCRPAFATAILDDLAWLGLRWDGPVRHQSAHLDDYRAALDRLAAQGLLYPCFCTRKDIQDEIARAGHAPHGPEGVVYPGICRGLAPAEAARRIEDGAAYALRLDMARACGRIDGPLGFVDRDAGLVAADPAPFGDVVLARKDVPTCYHLAVTVDDAQQGVTLVTRGLDLMPATSVHRLLQALLDLPVPDYHHHRLITDAAGQRLAKRADAASLETLRRQDVDPAALRAQLGF